MTKTKHLRADSETAVTLGDVMRMVLEEAEKVHVPKEKWLTMRFSFYLDSDKALVADIWLGESEEE